MIKINITLIIKVFFQRVKRIGMQESLEYHMIQMA
jgi:hypothetical protein